MPELPDVTIYLESLRSRIEGLPLTKVRIVSPFVLRSVDPPLSAAEGRKVRDLRRIGKQIVWDFGEELYLVFHLMIAGRFHLKAPEVKPNRKITLAVFDFPGFSIHFTEASSKKRASLHLTRGEGSLRRFDRGGLEIGSATSAQFAGALQRENRTLKRALTDPRILSGIGNAYSDEILHRARLSPLRLTGKLTPAELDGLFAAALGTLEDWTNLLRKETGSAFPEKVTAFRAGMAVHGKFGKPCPVCGTSVQRIVYAENESNYCPRCQTGGKILADRSLSRLLRDDWPATIEELEADPVLSK
jgi:formamidopyrimidine-DNA glycosylase